MVGGKGGRVELRREWELKEFQLLKGRIIFEEDGVVFVLSFLASRLRNKIKSRLDSNPRRCF